MTTITYHTGALLSRNVRENHRLIAGEHRSIRRAKRALQFLIAIGLIDEDEVDLDRSLSVLQADVLKEFLHIASTIQRATENVHRVLKIDSNTPRRREE